MTDFTEPMCYRVEKAREYDLQRLMTLEIVFRYVSCSHRVKY